MWSHWTAWHFCQSAESKTFTLLDVFLQRSEPHNTCQSKKGIYISESQHICNFLLLFYSSKAPLHSNNPPWHCCVLHVLCVLYYEFSVVGLQADRWPRSETRSAPRPYYAAGADISWLKAAAGCSPGGRPPSLTACHTQTNPLSQLSVVPIRKSKVTL